MDIKRINGKLNTVFRAETVTGRNTMVENFSKNCVITITTASELADELEDKLKELGLEVGK